MLGELVDSHLEDVVVPVVDLEHLAGEDSVVVVPEVDSEPHEVASAVAAVEAVHHEVVVEDRIEH